MMYILEYILYGIGSICVLLVLFLFLVLGEMVFANKIPFEGIVLQKNYIPERNSTGIGTGVMSNGKIGTIVTSNHESEKFQLIVKTDSKIITTDCKPEVYFYVKDSDLVNGEFHIGPLTKIRYSAYTLSKKGF